MHYIKSLAVAYSKTSLFKGVRASFHNILNQKTSRTFLSENYYCYEKWDKFLSSETMKKIGAVNILSADLDERMRNKGLITPLDMDLLAAKVVFINNYQELEFIENIFLNFRKTQAALYVRDSMHYSFARSYIDLNQADKLLQLLKLKYKYGLFIDSFAANLLMDTFVKSNDFERAALAAHEVMLQELNDNELTLAACLFCCFKHLTEAKNLAEQKDTDSEQDEKPIKRLVYFMRKPYNDEHFDLNSKTRLSGKTILFAVSNLKIDNKIIENSLKVFGLLMFEKYEKAVDLFEEILIKDKSQLSDFLVAEFQAANELLSQNEETSKGNEQFLTKWTNLKAICCDKQAKKQLVKINLGKELEDYLSQIVEKNTAKQIESQETLFSEWSQQQELELKQQVKNIQIDQKKAELLKRIDDLERQEEILTFFDKQQIILNTYNEKGFPEENPADIPIEPEESQFSVKFEKHFKPWPKYANRPISSLEISEERKEILESLKKIYLHNAKAKTVPDTKLITRK